MNTDQAREFLIKFMEENFTDTTYHRYILGDTQRISLAGDFAWQIATAINDVQLASTATIKRQEQEALKLHRDLAAEKLRADQGWHRYESANLRKNELEAERANWAHDISALKAAQPVSENKRPEALMDTTIMLSGHQLRMALDLINPGGLDERDELDDQLLFGIRQHRDDDGKISTDMCCWNGDTDGVLPLDGEYEAHGAANDAERLDWLNNNFFSDQKDEWDERQAPNSIKWKFFGPMGVQGNVRDVIDAARAKDQLQ